MLANYTAAKIIYKSKLPIIHRILIINEMALPVMTEFCYRSWIYLIKGNQQYILDPNTQTKMHIFQNRAQFLLIAPR